MPRTLADVVRQVNCGCSRIWNRLLRDRETPMPDCHPLDQLEVHQFTFYTVGDVYAICWRKEDGDYIEEFNFSRYGELTSHEQNFVPRRRNRPYAFVGDWHLPGDYTAWSPGRQ